MYLIGFIRTFDETALTALTALGEYPSLGAVGKVWLMLCFPIPTLLCWIPSRFRQGESSFRFVRSHQRQSARSVAAVPTAFTATISGHFKTSPGKQTRSASSARSVDSSVITETAHARYSPNELRNWPAAISARRRGLKTCCNN